MEVTVMKVTLCDICKTDTLGHYWIVGNDTLCNDCFLMRKKVDNGML